MNISDIYSVRIQSSFDDDMMEILDVFKTHPNKIVRLINYYKGLPLSYAATIIATDRGTVDFSVTAEQAYAIEQDRYAFIRTPLLKYDVFAKAQYVNVKKMATSLVKCCYVEIMAERRNFIRMAPEPRPTVVINSPLGVVEGELQDISLSGANVSIHHSCPLEAGYETSISFMLNDIETGEPMPIISPARLIRVSGEAPPRDYLFATSLDKALERQLSRYMIQRQIEVIKEIKDAIY
jgi:hypothetical protein